MKIEKMDKAACATLTKSIRTALAAVEVEHGVTIEVGGGSYTSTGEFTPKLRIMLAGAERAEFEKYASSVGLEPSDFGREFRYGNKTLRIVGLNLRAPRYPIVGEDVKTGKKFKLPEENVRLRLREAS